MEKADILKLVKTNNVRVSYVAYDGKSEVWAHFVKVIVDDKFSSYVKCKACSTLLKWKAKDGTSGLKCHLAACPAKTGKGDKLLTQLPGFNVSSGTGTEASRRVSSADRSDMIRAAVNFCARDIHPFSVVEGEGFINMASKLIQFGAKYGNIAVQDVLPSARTLSRHVDEICLKEKDVLKSAITNIARFGVTTDLWTNEDTSASYITVTLHFISEV